MLAEGYQDAPKITISAVSAAATGAAVLTGSLISGAFAQDIVRAAGAALILLLGIYMILAAIREEMKLTPEKNSSKAEKTAGILTRAELGDMDNSKKIELSEAIVIGAAVSADSVAAGFGLGASEWGVPIFCGLFQLGFLCAGEIIARLVRNTTGIRQLYFSIASGIILILTGVVRLL